MRRVVWMAAALTGALALAACEGGAGTGGGGAGTGDGGTSAPLTVTDPWLKATEDGDHMTGAFGTITNAGGEDVHIVAATSDVTHRTELHEMVSGTAGTPIMAEAPDGFVVPAGGEFVLEPGGNHLMLMELETVIEPGEFVEFTLELDGGATLTFEAEARTYAGANEHYDGDHGMDDH